MRGVLNDGTGVSTELHISNGDVTFNRVQDCDPIAEWSKAQHNAGFTGSSDVKHAARLPSVIVEKYLNDNNITLREFLNDRAHVARCVKDPHNAAFRIWKGKF